MILRVSIALLMLVSQASALQAPDLSPGALMRAFAEIGLRVGVVRTIEGSTVRLDALQVTADGRWIVIRVLPKRVAHGR